MNVWVKYYNFGKLFIMANHNIKFWGVRGSFPTPDKDKIKVGGHSSCVEVRTANNELIVFDMGTGFIPLGKALLKEKNPPKTAESTGAIAIITKVFATLVF